KGIKIEDLQQDADHDDIVYLAGETGIEEETIARFVIAHKLTQHTLQAEFWYAILGSIYTYDEEQTLSDQVSVALASISSLNEGAVKKALARSINLNEIAASFEERTSEWVEAFLDFTAGWLVNGADEPTFVRLALDHARIKDTEKQQKFAKLFNESKELTPEVVSALEEDGSFTRAEIDDLQTSFQIAELTRSDFTVVKAIKDEFGVCKPEEIRTLAKKSEAEWVSLVEEKHEAGEINLPFVFSELPDRVSIPDTETYGKSLERQFREAYPTAAFAGGLERALSNGGAAGLKHADDMSRFLDVHADFEFLNTPIDGYLNESLDSEFSGLVEDDSFRVELKAVQRVFKLTPNFEASDTLLSDDIHSAQQVYRMGESEFVRTYQDKPGFTRESAELAWNRAADTNAAVITIIADLKELEATGLLGVLPNDDEALAEFPNWETLFATGDLCECEHCRSVLSPASYFADLLMFLKDRKAANPAKSVKEILFDRRPDLGYLELNCDNALVPLPYIDVVCEVLEDVIADGAYDLELTGLTTMPSVTSAAETAVETAFTAEDIDLGADFTISQVDPSDPDLWVVHGEEVTYLLKKKPPSSNFYAVSLRNTKASAEELRAYPQYVNPEAYKILRAEKYPLSLPFDLFAEEVRAAFKKSNLKRWDLMRTLHSSTAPNNPTEGEIAAEYFGISCDASAVFDEKRLILVADTTVAGQKEVWGVTGTANWLNKVGNVDVFLQKTGLEYNDVLALIDLEYINPNEDIDIHHTDSTCDADKKFIRVLDATKLDRIHRFLRMWRKLDGWEMWELDLVIRHPVIGNGSLDETFLINLFYFSLLKDKLGSKASVEHVCALFGDLNTETRFTKPHKKREAGLYQKLFLNERYFKPVDPAFVLDSSTGDLPTGDTISANHAVILAALRIKEADLIILEKLNKASDGLPYITDDLTLSNLSFLWRHAWLSKLLKIKRDEWEIVLKIFQEDIQAFNSPKSAWE
ncbi:MAG: Tc toxin subunit A, partial [Anaerolineales bacterium]